MFCDNCGQSVANNSIVCNFCGQPLAAAAAASIPARPLSAPGPGVRRARENAGPFLVVPFSRTVLGALERGNVMRKVMAMALRIVGMLIVLGGLYGLFEILKASFQLSAQAGVGGVIFSLVFIAGIFAMVQICFYRAGSIDRLGESPFPVMSVISIGFRAGGEIYAVLMAVAGIGGCLFIWFAQLNPVSLLGPLAALLPSMTFTGNASFPGGLALLIEMVLVGFATLVFFYFLAEVVLVLADIAQNVRLLAKAGG